MIRLVACVIVTLALALAALAVEAQQAALPPLIISSAVPGENGDTIAITGENFGARPLVTLDLIPLDVQAALGTRIVAIAPVADMPAGEYLLTVSRGPSAAENGSYQLVLGGGAAPAKPASPPPTRPDLGKSALVTSDEPVAKIGDRVITMADVDRQWQQSDPTAHIALSRQLYEIRRRTIDAMVADELIAREATARGLTTKALLDQEIPKRTITLPDSAVLALYQSLGGRTRGMSLEEMRPALRAWLTKHTEPELAKMTFVEELTKVSTRAEVLLVAPRVEVERTAQDVTLGPATAVVEIVAFGDFQNPEYARLALAFGRVRETFGDRVRFVFKNLPLFGSESVAAAEAAQCAKEQDKFWAFHDALLKQPDLTTGTRLTRSAAAAGLNQATFDACVDSGKYRGVIRQAMDEAGRYGLQASPSFLINGRLAADPPPFLPPFDYFKRVIEEELSRVGR